MPMAAASVKSIHVLQDGLFEMECERAIGNAMMATGLGSRSLPLVSGLPTSASSVKVIHVLHDRLFDMECAQATAKATMAAGLSSRSLPLVRHAFCPVVLSFLFRGPPPPPCCPGLLRCLFNRVWYIRFPWLESLSSHRVVQHVLLLDERPIEYLRTVDPLNEVVMHHGEDILARVVRPSDGGRVWTE